MPENSSADTIRDEVIKADKQFTDAAIQVDSAALESGVSDDYLFINNQGRMMSKGEHIAALKSGEIKYDSLSDEDVKVRAYGDTAVLTARITAQGSSNGQSISGRFLVTRVYVKRDGRWIIVSGQATPAGR